MSNAPQPTVPDDPPPLAAQETAAPAEPDIGPLDSDATLTSAPTPPGRAWRVLQSAGRIVRALFVVGVALGGAAVVAGLSVDLGPSLRARAEAAGSTQIQRPLHIGRLSVRLLTGDFIVEDLMIEGLAPTDRPFFRGKRVVLDIPWWSVVRRDLLIRSVELSDWDMFVETFPGGRHNFPRFTSGAPRTGRRLITTTVQFVKAATGRFTYEDRDGSTWGVVAPNIDITVNKLTDYRGHVSFSEGAVTILSYAPMHAAMRSGFKIDRGHIVFDDMTLSTDGAESTIDGDVDMGNWPEQTHRVSSVVQFPRMREIFWADRTFALAGEGRFEGTFHLFKGGHELAGTFASDEAGFDALRFGDLQGALRWTSDRFVVSDTRSAFYDGRLGLAYEMANLGQSTPGRATFAADYADVNLVALTEALEWEGLRLNGQATGRNVLRWELGDFSTKNGEGTMSVVPPAGTWLVTREVTDATLATLSRERPVPASFDRTPFHAPLPVGGELRYRYTPDWIEVEPSQVSTPRTFVTFSGRTAYGDRSKIPFHVVSGDWQESDRVLAAIMTAVGARTNAIPIGGFGRFDGVMLGAFRRPRIEGHFVGHDMVAWDVVWGGVDAGVTVENAYADIENGIVRSGDSRIDASGRFALGYPRADGGEQINSRIRVSRRSVSDLRHAFQLDDYDFNGTLSGEFHVYGDYEGPLGFGRVEVSAGKSYGETFDHVESGVRLEGKGVRLDSIVAKKGATGELTGVAYVGFDGSYSFESSARRIPVESLALLEGATSVPLTGVLRFSAFGNGVFDSPRYDVRGAIDDFFLGDEGIGQVTGRLAVRGDILTIEQLDVASPRLSASGTGRVDFTTRSDADLTFRFSDASLDPYARLYQPRLSPFTTAVASGTLRVVGDLESTTALRATAIVEELDLRLFDYRLRNDGPVRMVMDQGVARIEKLSLIGDGTALDVAGNARLSDERLDISASGDANLSILQGLLRDIRSTGEARLRATIGGSVSAPVLNGTLSVEGGRIRHFALPHSIEDLNGAIEFNSGGASFDGLSGKLGGGQVDFGGSVLFAGVFPDEFGLTAVGRGLRLRYPEGFRSVVDADLALRGKVDTPVLSGTVLVKDALWVRTFDTSGAGVFNFSATPEGATAGPGAPVESRFPVRFDIRLEAPSALRIENSSTRLVSSASLTLSGTYDRPVLFGRADIDRGDILFEGHRYVVTRGSIDFANPAKIEPIFDIEAETRTRIPGETYRVTFRITGTAERLGFNLTSDPPLPVVDILALLFGDTRSTGDVELRSLRTPELIESDLVMARAARLLASPLSAGVGRVVEQALGVDAVQIAPSLGDITSLQASRLNPGARLTLSKRISSRMLLTLSRTLTASAPEQVILLEYNQSDRLSWILTQNEDRTYAVDVRVRRVF